MKRLTAIERETLERLADEFGVKTLCQHTGLSKHALKKAMVEGHDVPDDHHAAITDYLNSHV